MIFLNTFCKWKRFIRLLLKRTYKKTTFFVFSIQVMVFELQEGPLEASRIQFCQIALTGYVFLETARHILHDGSLCSLNMQNYGVLEKCK